MRLRRAGIAVVVLAIASGLVLLPSSAHAGGRHHSRFASKRASAPSAGTVRAPIRAVTTHRAKPTCIGYKATIVGTPGDDVLKGTSKHDVIVGLGGDDVILGKGNFDYLCTGPGKDTVNGGPGDDWIYDGAGNNTLKGGTGVDLASFRFSARAVQVDLAAGTATGNGNDKVRTVENIEGSVYDDVIAGNAGANSVYEGPGNDGFDGRDGRDTVNFFYAPGPVAVDLALGTATGDGADTFTSVEEVQGSPYDDLLVGDASNNWLYGMAGNDTLQGGGGFDGASFYLAPGPVTADLGAGTATGDGNDTLESIENLDGSYHDDVLVGDAGSNWIWPRGGNDTLRGGDHFDGVALTFAPGPVDVDLVADRATGEGTDTLDSIESIRGSFFDDTLAGDDGPNMILGDLGRDDIDGREGFDDASFFFAPAAVQVDLGTGSASGGDGADTLTSMELVEDSAFDDVLRGDDQNNWFYPGLGNDQIFGGGGYDGVSYIYSQKGVKASLTTNTATADGTDTFDGIEQLGGSAFNDELTGDAGANWLYGEAGNDNLQGGDGYDGVSFYSAPAGVTANLLTETAVGDGSDVLGGIEQLDGSAFNDVFTGDASNNIFYGKAGDDTFDGGTGIDAASFYAALNPVTADLASGTAAGEGSDLLTAIEVLEGTAFNDTLKGDALTNYLFGGLGDDSLDGRDGDDGLDGDAGNDSLTGGIGTDHCLNGESVVTCEDSLPFPVLFGGAGPNDVGFSTHRRNF